MEVERFSKPGDAGVIIYGIRNEEKTISKIDLTFYDNEKIVLLENLSTLEKYQQKGYAKKVIGKIEEDISKKGLIGLLDNGIADHLSYRDFYKKRGWRYLPYKEEQPISPDWMYFSGNELNEQDISRVIDFASSLFNPANFN